MSNCYIHYLLNKEVRLYYVSNSSTYIEIAQSDQLPLHLVLLTNHKPE